jgi:hypothetical protein
MKGLGSRASGLEFRVWGLESGLGRIRVEHLPLGSGEAASLPASTFRVQGLGFRVWGAGFGVWGLGFGLWDSGLEGVDLRGWVL